MIHTDPLVPRVTEDGNLVMDQVCWVADHAPRLSEFMQKGVLPECEVECYDHLANGESAVQFQVVINLAAAIQWMKWPHAIPEASV